MSDEGIVVKNGHIYVIVESIENLPKKKDYDNLLSNRDFRIDFANAEICMRD